MKSHRRRRTPTYMVWKFSEHEVWYPVSKPTSRSEAERILRRKSRETFRVKKV